jgi:hypothetical protein
VEIFRFDDISMNSRSLEGDPESILLVSVMVSALIVCFHTLFAVACRYNAVRGALQLARGNSWHLKTSIYIMYAIFRSQLISSITLTWPHFSLTQCDLKNFARVSVELAQSSFGTTGGLMME